MDFYFPASYHIAVYWPWASAEGAPEGTVGPFPSTGLLDQFNRVDSATSVGGRWEIFGRAGALDLGITNNAAYNPEGQWNFLYYDQIFGANQEVYVTIAKLQPQGETFVLYARLKDVTPDAWEYDGYSLTAYRWDVGGVDTITLQLRRNDESSGITISNTFDVPNPINGFKFGMSLVGSTIRAYYNNGFGWIKCLEATDGTYTSPGYIGLYFGNTADAWLDDFGGGTAQGPVLPTVPDLSYVNGFYVSILVANYNGIPIGELAADLESVAWKLNAPGLAKLIAPSPGTAAELLQIGNRILIEFDNGLPRWTGFIDPPRRWSYGRVELTAHSGHRLLQHRVTERDRRFEATTAGGILSALLREQAAPAIVAPGTVWQGGSTIAAEYHWSYLYDVLEDLAAAAALDFDVVGQIENGRLVFRVNLYERRGRALANTYLIEGFNITVDSLEEQGPIANEWFTAGAGAGWGETGRLYGHARDGESIFAHGLRQASETFSDVGDRTTLDTRTASNLAATKNLYAAISLTALNTPPGRFGDYDVGDTVNVELFSMPVGGLAVTRRVIGREFRPRDGGCEVLLV